MKIHYFVNRIYDISHSCNLLTMKVPYWHWHTWQSRHPRKMAVVRRVFVVAFFYDDEIDYARRSAKSSITLLRGPPICRRRKTDSENAPVFLNPLRSAKPYKFLQVLPHLLVGNKIRIDLPLDTDSSDRQDTTSIHSIALFSLHSCLLFWPCRPPTVQLQPQSLFWYHV